MYILCPFVNMHSGGIQFGENKDLKNIDSSQLGLQRNPSNLLPPAVCQLLI